MYRADWSSKPNALAYNDLLFNEWWTNEVGVADTTGQFTARGFKGAYNVTARFNRIEQTVTAKLDSNGEVTIELNVEAPSTGVKRPAPIGRGIAPPQ